MHPNTSFIYLVFLVTITTSKLIEIKCPSLCECDSFENLRRAKCHNQNIITLEADIPKEVEVIDLSFNQISHLTDQIFLDLKYTQLKLLNLSHNKISDIHINAFRGLESLKTIDFSHNYIQYILPNWFWEVTSLEELYLNNNNLMTLRNEQLESDSLKVLDISYCHISDISNEAFAKVPNLQKLDLSGNYLTQLQTDLIRPLNDLYYLNIEGNSFKCNENIKKFINYCKNHGIRSIDSCDDPFEETEKFQRIINVPPRVIEKNSWLYDENDGTSTVVAPETCTNNTITQPRNSFKFINILPWVLVVLSFFGGFIVGFFTANSKRKANRIQRQRRRYPSIRVSSRYIREESLIENMEELGNSTPIPQRRRI